MTIGGVLERYARAWESGDVAAIVASYHDDIVLHWYGRNALAGEHRGKAAALAALGELARLAGRKLVGVDDLLVGATRGALLVRERFEREGRVLELERVLVFRVQDERIAECWAYDRDARELDGLLA
jgi:ketosteroid isomerase-like protein